MPFAMVKKQQQLGVGGLITSLFSSSSSSGKEVLPCPSTSSSSSSSSSFAWPWSSCGQQPRTLSFRQEQQQQLTRMRQQQQQQAYFKTMNSAYSVVDYSSVSVDDSFFTASETSDLADASSSEAEAVIICARRSDRLFFEPDASSRVVSKPKLGAVEVGEDKKKGAVAFGGATAISMESQDPYRDFRESMEAMVVSHGGVKDWSWLEEMLGWYLRANGRSTHGLIVGAFVDLLVSLSTDDCDECSSSSSASL